MAHHAAESLWCCNCRYMFTPQPNYSLKHHAGSWLSCFCVCVCVCVVLLFSFTWEIMENLWVSRKSHTSDFFTSCCCRGNTSSVHTLIPDSRNVTRFTTDWKVYFLIPVCNHDCHAVILYFLLLLLLLLLFTEVDLILDIVHDTSVRSNNPNSRFTY